MTDLLAQSPILRFAILALVFLLVMGVAYVGITGYARRAAVRSELREMEALSHTSSRTRLGHQNDSAWARLADRIEKAGLSLADTKSDELRDRLVAAGFDSPSAPRLFILVRLVLIFVLPTIMLVLYAASTPDPSYLTLYLLGAVCAVLGMYIPSLLISARADRRREEIRHGFPDCLDLLLVCVEAGLGLEAAMDRVGREMIQSHPLVARLLSMVNLQLRAGAPRDVALRRMGESSGVDEVRSFATLLIQSDKLGTSVAATLRVYSLEMREKRRLAAEEKAMRLPVIISIPLVVCMLPTMIGVLMLPGVVRVVRDLLPAMGGH